MTININAQQRWKLCTGRTEVTGISWELPMVATIGEYDVLYDTHNKCYTVVAEVDVKARTHNYTDYFVKGDLIEPGDKDLILDPYHMCLLYQMHAEVGSKFEFEEP